MVRPPPPLPSLPLSRGTTLFIFFYLYRIIVFDVVFVSKLELKIEPPRFSIRVPAIITATPGGGAITMRVDEKIGFLQFP